MFAVPGKGADPDDDGSAAPAAAMPEVLLCFTPGLSDGAILPKLASPSVSCIDAAETHNPWRRRVPGRHLVSQAGAQCRMQRAMPSNCHLDIDASVFCTLLPVG